MDDIKRCRAVVFDAYGTLFDVGAPARALLGDRADAVSELWRRKQLEYTWLRSLMDQHADFAQVTAEALDFALAVHCIDDRRAAPKLLAAYRSLPVFGDALAVLSALRAGLRRLAILSNGTPELLRAVVVRAGLERVFDMVLSVEDVGVFKPHPKVYALANRRLAMAPEEICFVSANGWDAAGAAAFGFHAVWIDRRGEAEERLPGRPDARITTLADLPALLGVGA
jgi:2-haloacid dehalogenase